MSQNNLSLLALAAVLGGDEGVEEVGALAALTLEAAKSQGLVGEQPDGLVGAVDSSVYGVAELVAETNKERIATYKDIAAKNGTALPQVQALAGKNLIQQTPAGQYIKNAAGGWQKK